jgi:hypothetical protein
LSSEDDNDGPLTAQFFTITLCIKIANHKASRIPQDSEMRLCEKVSLVYEVPKCFVSPRYYDPAMNQMAKTMQHFDFVEVLDLSPHCAYGGGEKGMPTWAGQVSRSGMSGDE